MSFGRLPEQGREYRSGSQSKRRKGVECALPNILTPVLALKVHEKSLRKINTVVLVHNTITRRDHESSYA